MRLACAIADPGGDEPPAALVALHGFGSHALDLLGLAPELAGGRLLLICPQAPHRLPGFYGFSWSGADPTAAGAAGRLAEARAAVLATIDEATERYGLAPQRLALLGFSQGGMLAAPLALAQPERFAGLALLSTSVVGPHAGELAPAAAAAQLPILVQHGTRDEAIPVAQAHASLQRLRAAGLAPEYEEYPMAHEVSRPSMAALTRWLERVLGLAPA
jgi:phospholipase/carboxylesterase